MPSNQSALPTPLCLPKSSVQTKNPLGTTPDDHAAAIESYDMGCQVFRLLVGFGPFDAASAIVRSELPVAFAGVVLQYHTRCSCERSNHGQECVTRGLRQAVGEGHGLLVGHRHSSDTVDMLLPMRRLGRLLAGGQRSLCALPNWWQRPGPGCAAVRNRDAIPSANLEPEASPPQGDPDPGTPARKWPGPRGPSAKLARTPDPRPRPGPRTTRRFWALGRSRRRLTAVPSVFLCSTRLSKFSPSKPFIKINL